MITEFNLKFKREGDQASIVGSIKCDSLPNGRMDHLELNLDTSMLENREFYEDPIDGIITLLSDSMADMQCVYERD